jgi:hypothetical protein
MTQISSTDRFATLPHLRQATALATAVDPHVYEVAVVREKDEAPRP